MINIKGGTQTYSDSQQVSGLKSNDANTVSAADLKKNFGEEDIGKVLNRITDPNWVDPSKARKVRGDGELDKAAFMKLFLAQLKNQDPTNPRDSHEMAAQLAQFSSLEKLGDIDANIGKLAASSNPKNNFDALNLIGKQVAGDSAKVLRAEETEVHDVRYTLPKDAGEVKVKIKDGQGTVVKELSFSNIKEGKNEFTWNGVKDDGQKAPKGEYKVVIEARENNGKKIYAETKFSGRITGLNFAPEGPVLMIGSQKIRMSDIQQVQMPKGTDVAAVSQHQKTVADKPKEGDSADKSSEKETSLPPAGLMNDIGMSRKMINRLAKETGK